MVQSWCRTLKLPVPSSNTSAFSQARQRLSESFLEAVNTRVELTLQQRFQDQDLWREHPLKAIDGTTVTVIDNPEN